MTTLHSTRIATVKTVLWEPFEVAELLGLEDIRRQSRGVMVLCPSHDEHTRSCSITTGEDGLLRVHCFGCGFAGDVLSLIAAVHRLDPHVQFRDVLGIAEHLAAGRPVPATRVSARSASDGVREPERLDDARFEQIVRVIRAHGRLDQSGEVAAYLDRRHVLEEAKSDGWFALTVTEHLLPDLIFHFGSSDLLASGLIVGPYGDWSGALTRFSYAEHILVIPWRTPEGGICTVQRRLVREPRPSDRFGKYVFCKGRASGYPYGIERLAHMPADVPVAFVEGAMDVLALRRLCAREGTTWCVLGLPGVNGWKPDWAAFAFGRRAIIATDADDAGDRVVPRMAADLRKAGACAVERARPTKKDWADELRGEQ